MDHTIAGRKIFYSSETEFLVQVGPVGGRFRNLARIKGDLPKAEIKYNSINLSKGRKKRLLLPTSSFPTVMQDKKV